MQLTSIAFNHNNLIPSQYTCDGENINPPLVINKVPKQTKSLALIMDDPDAPMGTFDHWLVRNIPPHTTHILENSTPEGVVGKNSLGNNNYTGPCPPSGEHRYFFKLYALDTLLNLDSASDKQKLEVAMNNHIVAESELIGLYQRKK